MIFANTENECGMAVKWILATKKDGTGKRRPKQNATENTRKL